MAVTCLECHMSGKNDKPMFAGLSESARRPQDTNEFHLRGISVEIEPCSAGFDENSQFVDMGGVIVDRFDCRLLLDPLDLRVMLKANRGDGWYEEENGDLDKIRYGDLYDDGPRSVSNQGVDGGGEYGAVAFSYDAPSTNIGTSSLISSPPPPPYARAIVEQSLKDSIPPPSIGPVSLRQLAVMRLVAKYTAGLERDGTLLEDDGIFCRFEFVDSGHVHYVIFRDMVKRFKAVAGSHESVREGEGKPESIAMLLEYQEDDDDDDFISMKEKLSMKAIVCMMYNISLKRDAEAFLMRVKGMHGEGVLLHGTPEKRFRSFIQDLEDCIKEKRDCDDGKTKTRDDDDDGGNKRTQEEEEDPFALGDSDAQAPIDDSILAERRRKAQMMLKKRKHDHEEKTRLLRRRTVENDRLQREKTVSAIQQHRKMFQDSDEED